MTGTHIRQREMHFDNPNDRRSRLFARISKPLELGDQLCDTRGVEKHCTCFSFKHVATASVISDVLEMPSKVLCVRLLRRIITPHADRKGFPCSFRTPSLSMEIVWLFSLRALLWRPVYNPMPMMLNVLLTTPTACLRSPPRKYTLLLCTCVTPMHPATEMSLAHSELHLYTSDCTKIL
jgi:hypothetical protein